MACRNRSQTHSQSKAPCGRRAGCANREQRNNGKARNRRELLAYPIACLLLFCLPMPPASADNPAAGTVNRPVADKWALIIGISKFADPSINLKYPAKDAEDFYNFLIRDSHFARDHVRLLVNEEATREQILDELGDKWLPRVAGSDDLVVIYISSHGSASDLDVGGVNYILAYDSDKERLYSTGIAMQDLCRIIKSRIHSERTLIVLDACHSGAVTPDAKGLVRQGNVDIDEIVQGTGQLVLTSSLPSQISWESRHQPNSVFTRHLIQALRSKGPITTLGDAYQALKDQVESEVRLDRGVLQTPALKGKWEGKELVLAAPAARPRPAPRELVTHVPAVATTGGGASVAAAGRPPSTPPVQFIPSTVWSTYIDSGRKAYDEGRCADAETIFDNALKEAEKFGQRDPRLTVTLDHLTVVYLQQGKFAKAEEVLRHVVELDSKAGQQVLPAEIAHHLDHLGLACYGLGHYAEAESCLTRALASWESLMGTEHPKVAADLVALANVYRDQGNYLAAEPLYRRALAIYEADLGPDNALVARTLLGLAALYRRQNKPMEAEPLLKRALTICEKPRRVTPEDLAQTLELYGDTLCDEGKFSRAEQFYRRALQARENARGASDAGLAATLRKLADLSKRSGKTQAAEAYVSRLASLGQRAPGQADGAALYLTAGKLELLAPQPPPEITVPWRVEEKDEMGYSYSATWTWDKAKKQFTALYANGAKGRLKFEKYGDDQVVLLFRGSYGPYGDVTGRYVGQRTGNTIRGTTHFTVGYETTEGLWEASW